MDHSVRILRWAATAMGIGVLIIYNSVDANPFAPDTARPATTHSSGPTPPTALSTPAKPLPPVGPALPRSEPTLLSIPQIALTAPFTELKLNASGVIDAPPVNDPDIVGWYGNGPSPGERGTAIVAGHVDTRTGPAVFLLLRLLSPGNTVDITRADGTVATFVVDRVKTFPKDDFPNDLVYGDTGAAELRLITCGGTYDHDRKDYTSNVVAFAHLRSHREGAGPGQ